MGERIQDRPLMALINVLPWMSHREHYLKSMWLFRSGPWVAWRLWKLCCLVLRRQWCPFVCVCLHRGLMLLNYMCILFVISLDPLPSILIINWITVSLWRKVNQYVKCTITTHKLAVLLVRMRDWNIMGRLKHVFACVRCWKVTN